ncbi:SH3 domain-containing protein [Leptospira venezuelensis]|uniref:SH3 domain-containing protein n=1 Tax=Leptospira venezuelensis TaxID=1958811 RepID=UPI0012FF9961|nr:SH3 domain-containing protein [Leptospira venezuelensis]
MNQILKISLISIFLIINISLYSDPSEGLISGTNVRLRSEPSSSGKVIKSLNTGQKIKFISYKSEYMFEDIYLGRWIEVVTDDSVKGYMFDAFVTYGKDEEKFHVFFKRFYSSVYNNRQKKIENLSDDFFLEYCYPSSEEGKEIDCSRKNSKSGKLTNNDIIASDGGSNSDFFPDKFKLQDMTAIVIIDSGGSSTYKWHFKFIEGKWKLIRVDAFSC